ncbi:MAG: DnaD domain-containing protein [Solibacillus sp.]
MQQKFNRLRFWTEQGNVNVPQLFFQFYKELAVADDEALIVLQLLSFEAQGIDFPTPNDLANRTHFQVNHISLMLQRLMQKGLLEITQGVDASGKLSEKYSLFPLWSRLVDLYEASLNKQEEVTVQQDAAAIFGQFEQEFGRLLSPIEIETVNMWLDQDGHTPKIIRAALKEAVLAGKLSMRYVDRILFEWKKKNIKSLQQIEKHSEQFRQHTIVKQPPVQQQTAPPKVSFYNWLEERE